MLYAGNLDHNNFFEKNLQNVGRLQAIFGKASRKSLLACFENQHLPLQKLGKYTDQLNNL